MFTPCSGALVYVCYPMHGLTIKELSWTILINCQRPSFVTQFHLACVLVTLVRAFLPKHLTCNWETSQVTSATQKPHIQDGIHLPEDRCLVKFEIPYVLCGFLLQFLNDVSLLSIQWLISPTRMSWIPQNF